MDGSDEEIMARERKPGRDIMKLKVIALGLTLAAAIGHAEAT